jgi:hypothetical protein
VILRLRFGELVSHALENGAGVGAQCEILHVRFLGQPLLVDSRCVDRFLQIHAVVDDVEQRERDRRDDATAARRTQHQPGFAITQHDGGRHGAQRCLAGLDFVVLALHETVEIRYADLGREVVHLVVEQHARARRGDARAKPVVECVGEGDRVALAVDDRIVRRVGSLAKTRARLELRGYAGTLRIDT